MDKDIFKNADPERLKTLTDIGEFIANHPQIEYLEITVIPNADDTSAKLQLNLKVFDNKSLA